ncbi:MAG: CMP/dCMP deaminase zinc-binding protein [Flavipsychrobacter sp.]|nr:CMP/dCMP deaminase zinc-binding protein [Flavipsychrobacter sp.]
METDNEEKAPEQGPAISAGGAGGADTHFIKEALKQAKIAYEAGEVPVGAVVVWDNKIISRGHNQVEQLNDSTAHAEMIALTSAFSQLGSKYLPEATLYVTVEPCLMCAGAIYWSKLKRIVYGAEDIKNGYRKTTGTNWPFHPKAELATGVMADECAQLMKDFFLARR